MTEQVLVTVFSTRPPLEPSTHDEIRVIRPAGWMSRLFRIRYGCGHRDVPRFTIDAYGTPIVCGTLTNRRAYCGNCLKEMFERDGIRCARTGRMILPGEMVCLLVFCQPDSWPPYARVVLFDDGPCTIAIAENGLDFSGFMHAGRMYYDPCDNKEYPTCLVSELSPS